MNINKSGKSYAIYGIFSMKNAFQEGKIKNLKL